MPTQPLPTTATSPTEQRAWAFLFAAWAISLVSTFGALFIGEIMGQTPCILCWYQRVFMFPLPFVLGVGLYRSDRSASLYALPLALAGVAIAGFHTTQYYGMILEPMRPCTQGVSCSGDGMTILGGIPIPVLSLIAFFAIIALLIFARRRSPE